MKTLGIGLIGTGFMGKAHALAFRTANAIFPDLPTVRLELLCDTPRDRADKMAEQFGFNRATDRWQDLVLDPAVDIVSITTPNHLHRKMALAAIKAGKSVYCEKPMALTLADSQEMAAAADKQGVATIVGYSYIHNPAFTHAQRLIKEGVIGDVVHFRGWVDEDYQADPDLAWTWRAKISEAGLGALGDLGCHLISMAYGLCGPIDTLIADMQTIHRTRSLADGSGEGVVENEDTATALVRFKSGAQGSVSTSRSAWGRKNRLSWEVHGTKGMLCFDQERMNELHLYENAGPISQQGYKTILSGPKHEPYGLFCPAPGHQLGFNDLKVIEASALLRAIGDKQRPYPDFRASLEFERVIHAIAKSAKSDRRVKL